eukprot:TRINITY_DN76655_c0_g1_i1.p1 TRINITY_DN76655_c0_g1~~TRINITY_DN76655_c0_g1_i1.p1  ORF type:complete len:457 (+),score=71.31 TRINITY_DN76655_c0_g1_i1:166-1536(+)
MHVLIAAPGNPGHILPVLRIANALVDRGHEISLLTSLWWVNSQSGARGRFKEVIQSLKINVLPVDDGTSENSAESMKSVLMEHNLWLPSSGLRIMGEKAGKAARPLLEDLHARKPIDYAVLDFFAFFAPELLNSLGVDFCINLPGPGQMLWLFRHLGTENWHCLPFALQFEFMVLRLLVLKHVVMLHQQFSADKPWLVNSFQEIEVIPGLPMPCCYVGPLSTLQTASVESPDEISSFCDAAAAAEMPVVYVSLGSQVVPDEVITNAIYSGLAGGHWRVIWSLHPWSASTLQGTVNHDQFLISSWMPQDRILSHSACKAFVTHCGWGGMMEAAASGVPLIALPFAADQPSNALLIEKKGWGLRLPQQKVAPFQETSVPPGYTGSLSAQELREKVAKVLEDPSFLQVAQEIQAASLQLGGSVKAATAIEAWAENPPTYARHDTEVTCWCQQFQKNQKQ